MPIDKPVPKEHEKTIETDYAELVALYRAMGEKQRKRAISACLVAVAIVFQDRAKDTV